MGSRRCSTSDLRTERLNQRGRLFVLIGTDTFSAAMSNAAQFRTTTNATLVGQPIGERPNSYQEPRQFKLPNSHLVVRYSTRYYKFIEGNNNVVAPDKEIIPTWQDYKADTTAFWSGYLLSKALSTAAGKALPHS